MTKIVQHNLTNVRLVHADAVQVLKHMLRLQSVAEVWIFFADPWHKHRHHKRRLVNPAFADLVASRLAPGATLRLATDWPNYAMQMRDVLTACVSLNNPYDGSLNNPYDGSLSNPYDGPLLNPYDGGHASDQGAGPLTASSANGPMRGFAPRFEGRVMTRFEQKGLAAGRTIYDLELRRS
jgi:tRNA (guanine-N7-)-methyltransferase